jgi:hypothetical protein
MRSLFNSIIQKFKNSKIQLFKDLKIQLFKDSIIQSRIALLSGQGFKDRLPGWLVCVGLHLCVVFL